MTFQFAHMAPPGATLRRPLPVARWVHDARSGALIRHWQTDPAPSRDDAGLRSLLTSHAVLRAG